MTYISYYFILYILYYIKTLNYAKRLLMTKIKFLRTEYVEFISSTNASKS